MEKFFRFVDCLNDVIGRWASFLIVILTLAIGYEIFMRYIFAMPTIWCYDMTIMIFGSYTMLGAAFCHYKRGHVRMDLFYNSLSPRKQAIVDSICYIFLFFPLFTILLYKCSEYAIWAVANGERASGSVWRPPLGPFKIVIALGFALFFLQGIVEFLRSVRLAISGGGHES
jgi:TRAP-type mannitol/chloroaromatic compound transport system permease small subunit